MVVEEEEDSEGGGAGFDIIANHRFLYIIIIRTRAAVAESPFIDTQTVVQSFTFIHRI